MAEGNSRRYLPSDPDFLLDYLDTLPSDDSDDDFDGYVELEGVAGERQPADEEDFSVHSPHAGTLFISPRARPDTPPPSRSTSTVDTEREQPVDTECEEPVDTPPLMATPLLLGQGSSSAAADSGFTASPGLNVDMTSREPVDFFRLFFSPGVVDIIFNETTRYAEQELSANREHLKDHPGARGHEWIRNPMKREEVEPLLAILLTMGILGFPTLRSYWSTKWPFCNSVFSNIMSGRRFELILSYLHLNDTSKMPDRSSTEYDKLYKVRPFLDKVVSAFKSVYTPTRTISVDESIIGFKGRLSFIQYMPKKPTKWGIKAWVLADSNNGYVSNFQLYTGKENGAAPTKGLAHKVVVSLIRELEGKGYHLYMDNFYSSLTLFLELKSKGFEACGTVRSNCKGLSIGFKLAELDRGEVHSERTTHGITCLKWRDKRVVNMISTFHGDDMISKRRRTKGAPGGVEEIYKPHMVEQYNTFMGGVDRSDQLVLYYGFAHRCKKWWKRVFFHLMDLAVVNASILYNLDAEKPLNQLDFRLATIAGLLEGHAKRTDKRHLAPERDLPLRLQERPFPEPIPKNTKYGGRPLCEVCRAQKKRLQTKYRCKVCKTPLHVYPCLEIYHNKLDYGQ